MNTKTFTGYGIAFLILQAIINCGIFVTFPQMTAYAVSKEQFQMILDDLTEIKNIQRQQGELLSRLVVNINKNKE